MRARFYGVRGSIPTPGPSTVRYGGNSVCVEVRLADGTCIVLDAGTGIRECGKQIEREGYTGPIHLCITHPHWDHVIGLTRFPGFAELKRSLREGVQLRALGWREGEVGDLEDWHGGSRRLKK